MLYYCSRIQDLSRDPDLHLFFVFFLPATAYARLLKAVGRLARKSRFLEIYTFNCNRIPVIVIPQLVGKIHERSLRFRKMSNIRLPTQPVCYLGLQVKRAWSHARSRLYHPLIFNSSTWCLRNDAIKVLCRHSCFVICKLSP